jgi:hypothetical protein
MRPSGRQPPAGGFILWSKFKKTRPVHTGGPLGGCNFAELDSPAELPGFSLCHHGFGTALADTRALGDFRAQFDTQRPLAIIFR